MTIKNVSYNNNNATRNNVYSFSLFSNFLAKSNVILYQGQNRVSKTQSFYHRSYKTNVSKFFKYLISTKLKS